MRPRARKRDAEPEVLKLIDTLYATWKSIPLGKYENTSQGISGATFSPPATPPCGGTSVGLYHITLFYCSSASSRTCRGGFETTARTSFPVIGFNKTLQFLVQAIFRRAAATGAGALLRLGFLFFDSCLRIEIDGFNGVDRNYRRRDE